MTEWRQPETASEWLIALRESPEDTELRADFNAWLAADAENQRDWQEISRTYELLGHTSPMPGLAAAEHAPKRRNAISRRAMLGLAGAGIAASLAVFVVIDAAPPYDADYTTGTAEDRRIELADGSNLHLGPESAIAVDIDDERRVIRLFAGEAYFDVAGAPDSPFHVVTEDVEARVIGTTFEIQLADESTTVAVQEGEVEVSRLESGSEAQQLEAGDWLRLAANSAQQRGHIPPDQIAAWRSGRLIAKDRSVAEVVSLLRRYHSGMVLLPSEELARQSVTGVYTLADPISALRAIASAQDAELQEFTPWVVVLSE
ncbi:FecR family protein [Fodinicurvata halophila]|uniref:FecR family protein n=1 Tax=Fodinicurvata halophila TaxID=1419723 RepID=A0ABV8UHK7_9PROT